MRFKRSGIFITFFILTHSFTLNSFGHDIYFCGEKIPLSDRVAEKLMDIIKKQISYGVAQLRLNGDLNMKTIEYYLNYFGLPEDFKYLAIVESGLKNVVSSAGAAGFWQIMPKTAGQWGLSLYPEDERNDLKKATYAACNVLYQNYKSIKKAFGISSWVLAAASYNTGFGTIHKNMVSQGEKNYFELNLNKETAEYVYKIIAVKELFEYPELYIKNFGYNVFSSSTTSKVKGQNESKNGIEPGFGDMKVSVNEKDGNHPETQGKIIKTENIETGKISYIGAHVIGNYDNFKDSSQISVVLDEDFATDKGYKSKGQVIKGIGWIVDDKVFIDFGYGRRLLLIDLVNKKHDGILLSSLKNNADIMLKLTALKN